MIIARVIMFNRRMAVCVYVLWHTLRDRTEGWWSPRRRVGYMEPLYIFSMFLRAARRRQWCDIIYDPV